MSDPIDIVARSSLRSAAERWIEDGWETYMPEIGEYDYDRIAERMLKLLPDDSTHDEFVAAYKTLIDRAENTE